MGHAYHGILLSHKKIFFIHWGLGEIPGGKMAIIMKGQEEKYPWWENWPLSWPSQQICEPTRSTQLYRTKYTHKWEQEKLRKQKYIGRLYQWQ